MSANASVGNIARINHFVGDEDVAIVAHHVTHSTNLHVHEFFEIVYVERGTLLHRYGPSTHPVSAGDLFIVDPTIPHGYDLTPSGPAQIWNLLLTERALNLLSLGAETSLMVQEISGTRQERLDYRRLRLGPVVRAQIERTVKEMYEEYQHKAEGYQTVLRGQMITVVGLINRALHESGLPVSETNGNGGDLGRLTRYIIEHCDRPLLVRDLAARGGWTADHLNRLFKKMTGDTAQEYIGRVRAARAARVLLTEESSVSDVARQVGYGDARAFRRAFKRYYGVTPGEFRRRAYGRPEVRS